jgi:hypothetical protein
MEPWQIYFDELRTRAGRIDGETFDRQQLLAEAAHDAYRHTADRLTQEQGWDEERALVATRGMNETVREWIASEQPMDWDALRSRLEARGKTGSGA